MHIHPHFIAGRWIETDNYSINTSPSDATDIVGYYARAQTVHVEEAIAAAAAAKRTWGATSPVQRAGVMHDIAQAIRLRTDELARVLSREEGKTLREAVGEVGRAAATFEYFGSALLQTQGQLYGSARDHVSIHTRLRPVGVVAVITPWNFPVAVPAWKIAPALAYGNSVVFKPAEMVSGSAWLLADIISRAGLPTGAFNLVMGRGSVVGGVIAGHPEIQAITFTGSTQVGKQLLNDTHQRSNARVQTEMGGKNGVIVLGDADLDIAIDSVVDSAFASTGQRCTATSRIIVTRDIAAEFTERLAKRVEQLVVGHALDERSQIGPVAHEEQLRSDLAYIELGSSEGAELICGGERLDLETPGLFLQPALFAGGSSSMRLNQEEIFGPVACVIESEDLDEAIAVLNDTPYGLSAGIMTSSLASSEEFQRRVEAGMISVNASPAISEPHVPFGGVKDSGHGPREQGMAAQHFFTEQTTHFVRSH